MISVKSLILYLNLYSEPPSICSYSEEVRDVKKHRKSAGSSIPWRGKFEQRGKAAESPWNSIEELSSQKILSSHILKFSQNELSGIDSKIIVEHVYISDQFRFKSVRCLIAEVKFLAVLNICFRICIFGAGQLPADVGQF